MHPAAFLQCRPKDVARLCNIETDMFVLRNENIPRFAEAP